MNDSNLLRAKITAIDTAFVEKVLQMESGYVLDFSDRTFANFFAAELEINIDDPIYGLAPRSGAGPSYRLGAFDARGESGALVVSLGALSRLRSNPFFDVIRSTVAESLAQGARDPSSH